MLFMSVDIKPWYQTPFYHLVYKAGMLVHDSALEPLPPSAHWNSCYTSTDINSRKQRPLPWANSIKPNEYWCQLKLVLVGRRRMEICDRDGKDLPKLQPIQHMLCCIANSPRYVFTGHQFRGVPENTHVDYRVEWLQPTWLSVPLPLPSKADC